jgi:CheY-like chemotaxis protein
MSGRQGDSDRLAGVRILLAEDDEDVREVMILFLESLGAVVRAAASGNRAWLLFEEERPDIVVSDIRMPDGDGLSLVRRIRALPGDRGGLTPAVAVSATDDWQGVITSGFHALVAKPIDPIVFTRTIEDFVKHDAVEQPQATVVAPRPGVVLLRFEGHVVRADMQAAMRGLIAHLNERPCVVVSDLRRVTSFAASVASLAQLKIWRHRRAIHHVYCVGGPFAARVVSLAAASVLGIPCTLTDQLPTEALLSDGTSSPPTSPA